MVTPQPGDELELNGETMIVEKFMSYQGKEGCTDITCRHLLGDEYAGMCYGNHCANCDKPSSMYGHRDQYACNRAIEQPMGESWWAERRAAK